MQRALEFFAKYENIIFGLMVLIIGFSILYTDKEHMIKFGLVLFCVICALKSAQCFFLQRIIEINKELYKIQENLYNKDKG